MYSYILFHDSCVLFERSMLEDMLFHLHVCTYNHSRVFEIYCFLPFNIVHCKLQRQEYLLILFLAVVSLYYIKLMNIVKCK